MLTVAPKLPGSTIFPVARSSLRALDSEGLFEALEDTVTHSLRDALEITRDQYGATTFRIFEREGLPPEVVQLAVRRTFRPVSREPHSFFGRDDRFGQACFPVSCLLRMGIHCGLGGDGEPGDEHRGGRQ